MRHPLLLFISLFFFYSGFAQKTIQLDANFPYENIGKSVSYYEDDAANLSLNEVKLLREQGKFRQSSKEILALGSKKRAAWIHFSFVNKSTSRTFLVLDGPNIEHVDVYVSTGAGQERQFRSGSLASKNPGVIATNNYIFNLSPPLTDPQPQSVYIRVKTNNVLILPIKLAISENLIANSLVKARYESIYIGALVVLFLFNIFLYLSFRDHTYLYYSIYVAAFFVYLVFYLRGYSYFFGEDVRRFVNLYPHIFLSISCVASAFFSMTFLDVKKKLPHLLKGYWIMIACWTVVFMLSILGNKGLVAGMVSYLILSSSLFLWAAGLISYFRGHRPALYYLLAWGCLCLSILFTTLTLFGAFPCTDFTFYVIPAGTTIELLLLSFALGARFNDLRKQNMRLITTQKERLEKLVQGRTLKLHESVRMLKERTFELDQSIQSLEQTNMVKNKLFSIIAHDLRSPFNSLMSIFSLKDMEALNFEDLKMLLNVSRKNIENIHNTLNNLLYWAKSQMEGVTAQPVSFNLYEALAELIMVYQPLSQRKSIEIVLQAGNEIMVYADPNQVQLVLRNMIDNAIKFTPLTGRITISSRVEAGKVYTEVSNPVLDITRVNVAKFNSLIALAPAYGTANERGVGLGLHLCREFVAQNGGEFNVRAEAGQVTFSFSLPSRA